MNQSGTKMTELCSDRNNTQRYFSAFLLTVVVLIGLSIRLINLDKPGLAYDESFHAVSAQSILKTGTPDLPFGKPYRRALLFTRLVAVSFSLIGSNEFAARLPSVIFGTFTIILIFFVGKRFFGTTVGLISAIILALSPFEIAWSRECRMYAMFQFFFLFGLLAFFNGFEPYPEHEQKSIDLSSTKHTSLKSILFRIEELNWKWLIFSVVLFYISFSLHKLTVFFGMSLFVYCFIMGLFVYLKENLQNFFTSKYFFSLIIMMIGSGVILLAVPSLFSNAKELLFWSPAWASGRSYYILTYANFLGSTPLFPIGVFFLIGSIQILTHTQKAGFYTLVCAAVPLITISIFYSNLRDSRYIFNIFPLVILVASYAVCLFMKSEFRMLSNLVDRNNLSTCKPFAIGLFVCIFFLVFSTSFVTYGYRIIIDYYGKDGPLAMVHRNWRAVYEYVAKSSKPSDILITTEALTAYFYKFDNISYDLFKETPSTSSFSDIEPIPDLQTLRKIISDNPRGWIITDKDRFKSPYRISKDVSEFIENSFINHSTETETRLLVYSWNTMPNKKITITK